MCNKNVSASTDSKTLTTSGIHHLGLNVPNIKQTAAFFIEQLHFSQVGEKPDYPAIFVSDGTVMLTLWQVKDVANMVSFDRTQNVGLHHFALKVDGVAALNKLHEQFCSLDNVEIEFAPEPLGDLPIQHMMCLIPGGIRLELISA
ncbi:VOC family protein [Paraglaciecola aquimarina]|uniref:VOC family protein n=1 Tax=Paraglaciecola aquimarina TaxID=1235557 RepID=A0ABU3SUP3_9ALTE|nr:VOC family protein [Paraglaciecola aquimarina]MDU0353707.1 VOC family protein [Paraglaciecola aquimarina]